MLYINNINASYSVNFYLISQAVKKKGRTLRNFKCDCYKYFFITKKKKKLSVIEYLSRRSQMVYEAVRDIATGEELLLGLREPLQLQDMLGENTTEDRSDRETGEYLQPHKDSL